MNTLRRLRLALRGELEASADERAVGTGWISGLIAFFLSLAGLVGVLCVRFPKQLTVPEIHAVLDVPWVRIAIFFFAALLVGFLWPPSVWYCANTKPWDSLPSWPCCLPLR